MQQHNRIRLCFAIVGEYILFFIHFFLSSFFFFFPPGNRADGEIFFTPAKNILTELANQFTSTFMFSVSS